MTPPFRAAHITALNGPASIRRPGCDEPQEAGHPSGSRGTGGLRVGWSSTNGLPAAFLAFDLSALGDLAGQGAGAWFYNAVHDHAAPAALVTGWAPRGSVMSTPMGWWPHTTGRPWTPSYRVRPAHG